MVEALIFCHQLSTFRTKISAPAMINPFRRFTVSPSEDGVSRPVNEVLLNSTLFEKMLERCGDYTGPERVIALLVHICEPLLPLVDGVAMLLVLPQACNPVDEIPPGRVTRIRPSAGWIFTKATTKVVPRKRLVLVKGQRRLDSRREAPVGYQMVERT
jgi:hypothetical protein